MNPRRVRDLLLVVIMLLALATSTHAAAQGCEECADIKAERAGRPPVVATSRPAAEPTARPSVTAAVPDTAATPVTPLPTLTPHAPALPLQPAGPVVKAVLFWMSTCPHCHDVIEKVLPPLQGQYGAQLQIQMIELGENATDEQIAVFYKAAEAFGIAHDQAGAPFLLIGDKGLMGSDQIRAELPGLIQQYLAAGGVDYPQVAGLAALLPTKKPAAEVCAPATPCTDETPTPAALAQAAVVRAILFTTLDCHSCQIEAGAALTPVREKYGAQFEVRTIDVVTPADVEYLYRVAEGYGVAREDVDLPLLIIGEQILIGEQMAAELTYLVVSYLEAGGVDWPAIPAPPEAATPGSTPLPPDASIPFRFLSARTNGFLLAVLVMIGMVAALVYTGVVMVRGSQGGPVDPPAPWQRWLIPLLALAGLGVAGYLAYVETRQVAAVCGPVGDCNAVQASPYARLFGVLPIGVLGALGYVALLAAWLWRRYGRGRLAELAPLAVFALALFGVLFSLYLTYLEPFVIRAVCAWCLTSAVIMTALLLLSIRPALAALAGDDEA